MKRVIGVLLLMLAFILQVNAQVKVKGYYRKDGTYVQPHYRSKPDGNPYNNWSYPGNTNPYTGKTATGNPDTYLKNYYNRSGTNSSNNSNYYPNSSTTSSYDRYNNSTTYNRYSNSSYYGSSNNSSSTYYVTVKSLNIRSGTSTNYSIIGTLSYADNVTVIESYANGWKKIQYSYFDEYSYTWRTKTGYVSGYYLSVFNPTK